MSARSLLAPEVVQSSVMDCGPAALSCLLRGHGIRASYERLREACQTDVDGTSIDTIEEVARELGLDAEQVMLPVDHVGRPESGSLPALIVVLLPSGTTHFAVLWSRAGRRAQVMDPASGRRWPTLRAFLDTVYVHTLAAPAAAWRAWAATPEFAEPLRGRLRELGIGAREVAALVDEALAKPDWLPLAALDAACRMATSLAESGAVRRGRAAARLVRGLVQRATERPETALHVIPGGYWSAKPGPAPELVSLRGAVLVRVKGVRPRQARAEATDERAAHRAAELERVLDEAPLDVRRALRLLVRARAGIAPAALVAGLVLATVSVLVQALLLRGLLDLGIELALPGQRAVAMAALCAFLAALALLELPLLRSVVRVGRQLEGDLRVRFQTGVARLADRYLRSRPASDMAERAHGITQVAALAPSAVGLARAACQLALVAAGIAWLDPGVAPLAGVAVLVSVTLPILVRRALLERELSARNLRGALSRVYLEAMLGLVALRAHGAERTLRREHDGLLGEWRSATLRLESTKILLSAGQSLLGLGLAAAIVVRHFQAAESPGGTLLLCFWALSIPALGQELVTLAEQLPGFENAARRLLEPVSREELAPRARATSPAAAAAPSEQREDDTQERDAAAPEREQVGHERDEAPAPPRAALLRAAGHGARALVEPEALPPTPADERPAPAPVAIDFDGVDVVAGGHTLLAGVTLAIAPGSHVAVVGRSGAGKSTLVGLLLGWLEPARGALRVDGEPLDAARLVELRRGTAWVDPSAQLFNRTLFENLRYGAEDGDPRRVGRAIARADLLEVIEGLPGGLQGKLGEGGGLVSGGEGQRVRLARAACREGVRLVVLDEPFRGLERERRSALLARARELWRGATLLCVTHDLAETRGFDAVVVVESGRVVEVGPPDELARRVSRYRALCDAEAALEREVWRDPSWRRVRLADGRAREEGA